MGRAVLADADRVASKNVNVWKLRQRCEPNGSAAIVGEHQEGRARSAEQSMIRDTIENRAHPMFANTEPNVATGGSVPREIAAVLDVIHGRSIEIGAAAHQ